MPLDIIMFSIVKCPTKKSISYVFVAVNVRLMPNVIAHVLLFVCFRFCVIDILCTLVQYQACFSVCAIIFVPIWDESSRFNEQSDFCIFIDNTLAMLNVQNY